MSSHEVWLALALMGVIDGLFYALFPEQMKRTMAQVSQMPADTLRSVGLTIATIGVACLWGLVKI